MTSHTPHTPPVERNRARELAAALGVVGALLLLLLLWHSQQTMEHDAIRELPEHDRQALYQRTLHTLVSSCEPPTRPEGLERFCGEQAEFIVQFPECDEACRELAKRHQNRPTK